MAPVAAIAAVVGVVVAGAGVVEQYEGAKKQNAANKNIANLEVASSQSSLDAEKARQDQMNLDADRQRRAAYRQSVIARAHEVSAAVGAGTSAAVGQQSTGLLGATSQTESQFGYAFGNVGENQQIGTRIFSDQESIFADKSQEALYGYSANKGRAEQQQGNALYGFGASMVSHASTAQANADSMYSSLFGGSSAGGGGSSGGSGN